MRRDVDLDAAACGMVGVAFGIVSPSNGGVDTFTCDVSQPVQFNVGWVCLSIAFDCISRVERAYVVLGALVISSRSGIV